MFKKMHSLFTEMSIKDRFRELEKQHKSARYALLLMEMFQRFILVFLFLSLFAIFYIISVGKDPNRGLDIMPYAEFLAQVDAGHVSEIAVNNFALNRVLIFKDEKGKEFRTIYLGDDDLKSIVNKNIRVIEDFHAVKESDWAAAFMQAATYTGLIALMYFMMSGSTSKDSDHDTVLHKKQKIGFNDVKGVDEACSELREIISIFSEPDKFRKLGVKSPKGVLLNGPPGTGKTLLAKAAAYECNAMFIAASGSSFVQMFVGLGALRVRRLFNKARKHKPTIIFIDEIDALCGKRDGVNTNTEHNTTVNAILAEMDGVKNNEHILIIGATNNPDSLDPAIKRPGRFDRHIYVGPPNQKGRQELFQLYLSKLVTKDIDFERLGRSTTGLSGAQIAAITNEAGILAAREDLTTITMDHIERARDRMLMGYERKGHLVNDADRKITAYHEAGHAIVSHFKNAKAVINRISILPRGQTAGHTMFLDKEDQIYASKTDIESAISILLGGRAAEKVVLGDDSVTTGAANDLAKANELALAYVGQYGFSTQVGLMTSQNHQRNSTLENRISEATEKLLVNQFNVAVEVLTKHRRLLDEMADLLLEMETLDKTNIDSFFSRYETN